MYQERNDERRKAYLDSLAQIPEGKRVYVDETGFDAPLVREYAYAKPGQRVLGERTGKRFARTSLIAALKEGKPIAPMEFKGYCNTEVVLAWVKQALIPSLQPGVVVIWDNATFHKSPKIAEALAAGGIHILFLPPYSPDLNPIEQFWATLKAWIRMLNQPYLHISKAITKVFQNIFT